jgi:hypothetical protein
MLSIICRNQKTGVLSGRLKIALKKGKIKRISEHALQIIKRMLIAQHALYNL